MASVRIVQQSLGRAALAVVPGAADDDDALLDEVGDAVLAAARDFVLENGACTLRSCTDNFWFLPDESDRLRLGLVLYQARWINQTGVALALDNRQLWAAEDREAQIFTQIVLYGSIVEELARVACKARGLTVTKKSRKAAPETFYEYVVALGSAKEIPTALGAAAHSLRTARNKIHVTNRGQVPHFKRRDASSAVAIYQAFRLVLQDRFEPGKADARRTKAALDRLTRSTL
jgi:hypothetical protein